MKIGGYNATKKLFQSPKATTFAASKADDSSGGQEKYILKSFQPNVSLLEKADIQRATDYFINAAKLQQKIAKSSKYWAPVHECGTWQSGAYFVTDNYQDTAQRLIDSKVSLSPQQLFKIVKSTVIGLLDLKQKCGRSHGNLKPTNILIQNLANEDKTKATLVDPIADQAANKKNAEVNDLQAIGELIYRLVLHRVVSGDLTATLHGNSKKWNILKKDSERWRKLCHDLMFTDSYTLESLHEIIPSLKPQNKPIPIPMVIVGFLLILSVFIYYFVRDKPNKSPDNTLPEFSLNKWAGLCLEQQWFTPLYNNYLEMDDKKRSQWDGDPDLRRVSLLFEKIDKHKLKMSPNKIAIMPKDRLNI